MPKTQRERRIGTNVTAPSVADLLSLCDKVAVVTGASQGIGAGVAMRLAEAGAMTVVHYRSNESGANSVVEQIHAAGGKAVALGARLEDELATEQFMDRICNDYKSVDVLVNNAGVFPSKSFLEMSLDEWHAMFVANVDTAFNCAKSAAKIMQVAGGGAIVNVASISALCPDDNHSHYNSSKAALVMLTRSMAKELARHSIRVNAVSPGLIDSDKLPDAWPEGVKSWIQNAPLGVLGQASDVGDACLFLCTAASRFITGHNLVVDGGMLSTDLY